ncbi:transmembrane protease serine 4-like [Cylas formicarius]|uniref:transmembrane protease serine 4-like n=1 Tax=Cylas formicarius TaxID=197179 RepID=UPI002958603F|nr:transmembrane protease serine 4-like [Cylas formicarius]
MFATHAAIIISLYALTDPCLANRKHMLRPTYKRNPVGSECGRPLGNEYVIQTDRIVAGYDVGYYRYPWYAALVRSNQVNCGGALIGPQIVLTAAHCFKEYLHSTSQGGKLEDISTVRLGMYNICASEKEVTEYRVVKVEIHELYPKKKPYYDIWLLTLANSTDSYRPVCLPNLSTFT